MTEEKLHEKTAQRVGRISVPTAGYCMVVWRMADRDIVGARNILLRALVDSPMLLTCSYTSPGYV